MSRQTTKPSSYSDLSYTNVPELTSTEREKLINKTVKNLPNNPSASKIPASVTKPAFYRSITDSNDSIFAYLNNKVAQLNVKLTDQKNKLNSDVGTNRVAVMGLCDDIDSVINDLSTLSTAVGNIKGEGYNASGTYATLKAIADRLATYDGFFYNLDNVDDSLDTLSELANKITELSGSIDEILADTIPLATTSTNGLMSSTDKVKLNSIANGAEVNVQSNWNQSDSTQDDFIKNKPTIPSTEYIDTQDINNRQLLGQYDTRSGNVVTRKTIYIKLDGNENWVVWTNSGVNGFKLFNFVCSPITVLNYEIQGVFYTYWSKFITNKLSSAYSETELYGSENRIGIAFTPTDSNYSSYTVCLRYTNTTTTVEDLRKWLSANPIYIQAESQTSYTETLEDKHYSELNVYYDNIIEQSKKNVQLWNESWEQGEILSTDGSNVSSTTDIRSGYISVSPNTKYTYSSPHHLAIKFFNSSYVATSSNWDVSDSASPTFTTNSDTCYIRFRTVDYGGNYNNDIIINKGNPMPYQPYEGEVVRQSGIIMLDDYDNTKGTVEARLTNLGFKSGTITLSSNIASITTNYVAQQGKNGILNYEGTITATNVTTSTQLVQIGTLPSGFEAMPTYCWCILTPISYSQGNILSKIAKCYIRTNVVYITNFEGIGYFNAFSILNMGFKIVS